MEARMLSLFDDEDFLPQEKPKPVKPKKSLAKRESVQPEAEEENEPAALPETITATKITVPAPTDETITEAMAMNESPEALAEPNAPVASETATEIILSDTTLEENAGIEDNDNPEVSAEQKPAAPETVVTIMPSGITAEENVYPEDNGNPEISAEQKPAAPETTVATAPPVPPEDDELNKQLLSELILSDYTAFIHKDYPFDLKTVEVVKKDKEIKVPEPVKEIVARAEKTEIEETEEETDDEPVAPLPEWNLDKRYYTIGEVSQLFKVNTSHIRFWTNEFKLRPRTTRKGDRLYSPEDIAQLRLIHHLVKEKKHTIKGAKEKLKAEKGAVGNKLDLKDSLVSLKEMLVQIKEQL